MAGTDELAPEEHRSLIEFIELLNLSDVLFLEAVLQRPIGLDEGHDFLKEMLSLLHDGEELGEHLLLLFLEFGFRCVTAVFALPGDMAAVILSKHALLGGAEIAFREFILQCLAGTQADIAGRILQGIPCFLDLSFDGFCDFFLVHHTPPLSRSGRRRLLLRYAGRRYWHHPS